MSASITNTSSSAPIRELFCPGPRPSVELVYDERAAWARLAGPAEGVIKRLGLEGEDADMIRGSFRGASPAATMQWLALGECLGISTRRSLTYVNGLFLARAGGLPYLDHAWRDGLHHFAPRPDLDAESRSALFGGKPAFECRLLARPSYMTYTLGQSPMTRSLSLHLPEEVNRHLIPFLKPGPDHGVYDSFGYIKFGVDRNVVEVREFGNPIFDRIRDPELRTQYMGWAPMLLNALHYYLETHPSALGYKRAQSDGKKQSTLKIRFPNVETALLAYGPKIDDNRVHEGLDVSKLAGRELYITPGINPDTAGFLYRHLPLAFGYRQIHADEARAEDTAARLMEIPGVISVEPVRRKKVADVGGAGSEKASDEIPETGPLLEYRLRRVVGSAGAHASFEALPMKRYHAWRELAQELVHPDVYTDLGSDGTAFEHGAKPAHLIGDPRTARIRRAFAVPPAFDLDLDNVAGVSSKMIEAGRAARQTRAGIIFEDLLPHDFTLVSRGIGHGMSDRWWEVPTFDRPGIHFDAVHLVDQNRNPSVRCFEVGDDLTVRAIHCLALKGGGLGAIADTALELPEGHPEVRLPIYRRTKADESDGSAQKPRLLSTHENWGGMARDFGEQELLGQLAILDAVRGTFPELQHLVPQPLRLSKFLSLPVFKGDAEEWMGMHEYAYKYLDDTQGRPGGLVTVRSIVASDVRIGQAVDRVFNRNDRSATSPELAREEIESSLRFIYLTHGCPFTPTSAELTSSAGRVENGDVLEFLRKTSEANGATAMRIFEKLCAETIAVIGMVHGTGGHLGGGETKSFGGYPLGAPRGGCTHMRNMNLAGGFHDFDASLLLPTALSPWCEHTQLNREFDARGNLQKLDLMYWGESMYWMRKLLFGGPRLDTARIIEMTERNDITLFDNDRGESDVLRRASEWLENKFYEPCDVALLMERFAEYEAARERGRAFALERGRPASFLD